MKKTYVTPDVEKVAFQYRDQVVVASGTSCTQNWTGDQSGNCQYQVVVPNSGYVN